VSTFSPMIALLLGIAIVGVIVWLIIQAPMPPMFRNVIIGVAVLLLLLGLLHGFGYVGGAGFPRWRW
jgi:hypothetical protein